MYTTNTYTNSVYRLSLTKWIHLNNGDEGLLDFFNRVHSLLQDDGKFIVETQSTKSYYNAINSMPVEFNVFICIFINNNVLGVVRNWKNHSTI